MTHTLQNLVKTVALIRKYAHCWSDNPSSRMYRWVDFVNECKANHPTVWAEYNLKFNDGFTSWDAYDLLA